MKEYVNVKELLEEVDAMAKRGTLLARGGVTQEEGKSNSTDGSIKRC